MTHEQNGTPRLPPVRAASDFAQLLSRLFDLMELQMELLGVDAKKSGKTLLLAATLFALALGLAIATAVTLLLTLGAIIAEGTQLSVGVSLLIATVTGMLLTAASGVFGWKFGRNAFVAFDRSKGEFHENLVWIKQAMKQSSRGHEVPER